MKKLNFQEFRMPTGVSRKEYHVVDVRESLADMIYKNAGGVAAHHLAFKIYESRGEATYTDEEVALMTRITDAIALPGFIDGMNEQLNTEQYESDTQRSNPI